jgi:hypothetical protein
MREIIVALINLIGEAIAGRKTETQLAKDLIDQAFASGVPASVLAQHLTGIAARNVELAADLAQWAKFHGPRAR